MVGSTVASYDLSTVITTAQLQNVLNQVISLIPIVFPVVVSFLAIRKGISWVIGMIQNA